MVYREAFLTAWSGRHSSTFRSSDRTAIRVIGLIAVSSLVALGLVLTLGEVTRKITATGVLVPQTGSVQVPAGTTGSLRELKVALGVPVKKGDRLGVISMDQEVDGRSVTERMLQALDNRMHYVDLQITEKERRKARIAEEYEGRVNAAKERRKALDAESAATENKISLILASISRLQTLQQAGYVSDSAVQPKYEDIADMEVRKAAGLGAIAAADRDVLQLAADAASLEMNLSDSLSSLRREREALSQERADVAARGEKVLKSPVDGSVTSIHHSVGAALLPTQTVLTIEPASSDTRLWVELLVPAKAIGHLKTGDVLWLRVSAFPFQKFGFLGSKVMQIEQSPTSTADLSNESRLAAASSRITAETIYRVKLRPERDWMDGTNARISLKSGMLIDTDILAERRKLYEILFEPLISMQMRRARLLS